MSEETKTPEQKNEDQKPKDHIVTTQHSVTINGRPLSGKVVQRDFAGTRKSTAFLAFSESWMRI